MTKLVAIFLCCVNVLLAAPSIVFIHLGPEFPVYLCTAIKQARLFNPSVPIYLVANEKQLQKNLLGLSCANVTLVATETLCYTPQHERFLRNTSLDKKFRRGFWVFATERFFYLLELMNIYNIVDVVHLESDMMIYVDLQEIMPVFHEYYSGCLGITCDNDMRCIPGFVYVANSQVLSRFCSFVAQNSSSGWTDMEFFMHCYKSDPSVSIACLPIVMPQYVLERPLVSPSGHRASVPALYMNHATEFSSLFDAAAVGQYLGGIDPRNGFSSPGFINESCVINPALFTYQWIKDDLGRKVPYVVYQDQKWRMNNLHIHCKNLQLFSSMPDQMGVE